MPTHANAPDARGDPAGAGVPTGDTRHPLLSPAHYPLLALVGVRCSSDPLCGVATGDGRHLPRVSAGHGRHRIPHSSSFSIFARAPCIYQKKLYLCFMVSEEKPKTKVFARCGFPTGKPTPTEGLDPYRGPRLPGYILPFAGGPAARSARNLRQENRVPGYAAQLS